MARFSRDTLTQYIKGRLVLIQKDWGFDVRNGWAQVESIAHDRMRTNPIDGNQAPDFLYHLAMAYLAYGQFCELHRLVDTYELFILMDGFVEVHTKTVPRVTRFRPVEA